MASAAAATMNVQTCTICLEDINPQNNENEKEKPTLLKCSHVFHNKCIQKWLKEANTCPNCRRDMTNGDLKEDDESLKSRDSRSLSNVVRSFFQPLRQNPLIVVERLDRDVIEDAERIRLRDRRFLIRRVQNVAQSIFSQIRQLNIEPLTGAISNFFSFQRIDSNISHIAFRFPEDQKL